MFEEEEEEKITKSVHILKHQPERFGLAQGASVDLQVDDKGMPYHLWNAQTTKVDHIQCVDLSMAKEKPKCYFRDIRGNVLSTVDANQMVNSPSGALDSVEVEGLQHLGGLVAHKLRGKLNSKALGSVRRAINEAIQLECELRNYERNPNNFRWVRYVCHPKQLYTQRKLQDEEQIPVFSDVPQPRFSG